MKSLYLGVLVLVAAGCPDETGGTSRDMAMRADAAPDMVSTVPIGGDCTVNSDCKMGQMPACIKQSGAATGFCTANCTDDADCGDAGGCIFFSDGGRCGRACESASDCPPNQPCWLGLPTNVAVCYRNVPFITLNCDPTVADCMTGGKAGGCDRQAVGTGNVGECVQRCVAGVLTCPAAGGSAQGCFALDRTGNMAFPNDTFKGTFCGYIQPEALDGAECLLDGNHYYNVCPQGSQCDIITTPTNATPDNLCHKLCYLGNFTPPDPGALPDGGMVAMGCAAGTCQNVFGLMGTNTPVGLCK